MLGLSFYVSEAPVAVAVVSIPKVIVEKLVERGIDVETYVVDMLAKAVGLDPEAVAEAHLELAVRFLAEGKALVDRDPVQASEKLYKAAEEAVKALAIRLNLSEVLRRVEGRGRWSATDLEKAVLRSSERLGGWVRQSWDAAWVLHVWGFHEARLDAEDVKARAPDVERLVEGARRVLEGGRSA
jgi:hypothetical protein